MEAAAASPRAKVKAETPEMGPARLRYAAIAFGVALVILVGSVAVNGVDGTFNVDSPNFGGVAPTIAALFALVGLIYLASGVLHTLRFRAFGTSELAIGEARLGHALTGSIRTERDLAAIGEFKLRLRCNRVTSVASARGGRNTQTDCLWESVKTVPAETRSTAGIPVNFEIPANGVASGPTGPDGRIDWVLDVKAPLRGLDYVAEFPVNVSGRTLADAQSRKRGEEPFAGSRAPPSRWSLILLLALLLFGGALSVAGAFAVAKQINLSTVAGFVLGIVLLCLAWVTWRRRSA